MNTLDILPVKQGITHNTVDFPEHLPDINTGSILTLIAPPKSGKSVLISNLFLRASFFKDKFDKIYIFSTTACNGDNSCRFLVEDEIGSRFGSRKRFFDLLYEATEKPYNFLYLDLYHRPPRAYRNFSELIYEAPHGFKLS